MSAPSTILWQRLDMPGHEIAELGRVHDGWELRGLALLAYEGQPCRLEYRIGCDAGWCTRTVRVHGQIGDRPVMRELTRSAQGEWEVDGRLVAALRNCIDVDLGSVHPRISCRYVGSASPWVRALPCARHGCAFPPSRRSCWSRRTLASQRTATATRAQAEAFGAISQSATTAG